MKSKTSKTTDDEETAKKERLRRSAAERSSTTSPTNVPSPKPISNSNVKEVSAATAVSVTSTSKIPASIKIKTTVAEKEKEKEEYHNKNKELEEELEEEQEGPKEKNKKEKEDENVVEEKSTTSDSSNSSSSDDSSADDEERKENEERKEIDEEEEVENEEENTGTQTTQTTVSTLTRNTTTTNTATNPTIEEEDPITEYDGKEKENGNEEDPIELDLESGQKGKEIEEEDPILQFGYNSDSPTKSQQGTNVIPISNRKDYTKGNGVQSNKGLEKFEYVDYNNSISTWTPLTQKEWSEWDLEHPPGENHKFWTKKAPIILHALEVWILNNIRINVPYMWHEEYNCHRNRPPKRPNHDSSLLAVRMPTIYDLYNNVRKKVEGKYGTYSQYSSEKFASEIKYHPKMEELKQKMTKEDNVLTTAKKRFAVIHTSYKKLNVDSIATNYGIKLTRMFNDEKTKIENCIKKKEAFKKQFSKLQKRLSEHINEKVNLEKMDMTEFTEEEIESMKSAFTDASWADTYDENLLYNGGSTECSTVGGTQTSHSSAAHNPPTFPGQNKQKNPAQVAARNRVDVTDADNLQKESSATSQKDLSVSLLDDNRLPPERKVEFSLSKRLRDKLLDKKLTKFNWTKLEKQNIDQHLSLMKFDSSVIASLNLDI